MAPVTSPAVDGPINETGQVIATFGTYGLAVIALVLVVGLCRRERIRWPLIVLVGGTVTCLLEPLFDHLYGLWFPTQGQWTLFTAYGISEPVWLPAAYLVVYGALPVLVVKALDRAPTQRTVWKLYGGLVAVAMVAEIGYVKVLEVYNYQDQQPFEVLGYPLFLGFVNSMSALIAGIAIWRLVPLLAGRMYLILLALPPLAFGVDAVGSGVLYLAYRHSAEPADWLLHVLALTVVLGGASTVRLLAMLLPDGLPGRRAPDPASAEPERELAQV